MINRFTDGLQTGAMDDRGRLDPREQRPKAGGIADIQFSNFNRDACQHFQLANHRW